MTKPDRILASELLEREVLDLAAGEIIGTVVDFALTREGQVLQIGVLPLSWYAGGQGLAPDSIVSVNPQRICIQDDSTLAAFQPDGEAVLSALFGEALHGKNVLQQDGEQLGRLADFSLTLTDGLITDLIVMDAEGKRVRVPVAAFKTIGPHYIVIEKSAATESLGSAGASPVEHKPAPEQASVPAAAPEVAAPVATEATPVPTEEPAAVEVPPELDAAPLAPAPAAKAAADLSRSEEKAALFGAGKPKVELSKFDQKKRDYLSGKPAHRDLKDKAGTLLAAKGEVLNDEKLELIVAAGILGEVFVEMTLNK